MVLLESFLEATCGRMIAFPLRKTRSPQLCPKALSLSLLGLCITAEARIDHPSPGSVFKLATTWAGFGKRRTNISLFHPQSPVSCLKNCRVLLAIHWADMRSDTLAMSNIPKRHSNTHLRRKHF